MITEECFAGFPSIFGCVFIEAFGSIALASFVALILLVYAMHKAGLSMAASIPLGFIVIFSLFWIAFEGLFQSLMLLAMLVGSAILGFALFRYFKRG